MTLLDAHHAERLDAIGRDPELLSRRHDGADQRVAIAGRDGQFVGKLARERQPVEARPDAADRHLARAEMRQRLVADVDLLVDELAQHLARPRPRDRELRPLLGHGHELHVERRPQHLMAEFEMLHRAHRVRGGAHHDEALGRKPRDRAVVHHEAVLAQQQRVARLADRERREGVGADAVEENGGVRALDLDLAEGRDVAHADATAGRCHFSVDGFQPVLLAGPRDNTARAATRRFRRTPRPARLPIGARA